MIVQFEGGPLDGKIMEVPDGTAHWSCAQRVEGFTDAEYFTRQSLPSPEVEWTEIVYHRSVIKHGGVVRFVLTDR